MNIYVKRNDADLRIFFSFITYIFCKKGMGIIEKGKTFSFRKDV